MGDSGEGLVDNESRIQELIEDLKMNRVNRPVRKGSSRGRAVVVALLKYIGGVSFRLGDTGPYFPPAQPGSCSLQAEVGCGRVPAPYRKTYSTFEGRCLLFLEVGAVFFVFAEGFEDVGSLDAAVKILGNRTLDDIGDMAPFLNPLSERLSKLLKPINRNHERQLNSDGYWTTEAMEARWRRRHVR